MTKNAVLDFTRVTFGTDRASDELAFSFFRSPRSHDRGQTDRQTEDFFTLRRNFRDPRSCATDYSKGS